MAMHTWFECKIRYEKVMENGMQKKVTEPYLVDAFLEEVEERIEMEIPEKVKEKRSKNKKFNSKKKNNRRMDNDIIY